MARKEDLNPCGHLTNNIALLRESCAKKVSGVDSRTLLEVRDQVISSHLRVEIVRAKNSTKSRLFTLEQLGQTSKKKNVEG